MPTRPRIEIAGYHHIINRGVNKTSIFNSDIDKDSFMQILNKMQSYIKLCFMTMF